MEFGKIHYTDFNNDEFNIEWVKFDADSPMPEMMQKLPHVAYLVENMEEALENREILVDTFSPGEGVRVAFIVHNGSPVEFMEIKNWDKNVNTNKKPKYFNNFGLIIACKGQETTQLIQAELTRPYYLLRIRLTKTWVLNKDVSDEFDSKTIDNRNG